MTHHRNHNHATNDRPYALPVRFEFTDSEAVSVSIAGTFNNWQRDTMSLHPAGKGRWVKETLLPVGAYEYCLGVDGRFRPDPLAPETIPNTFSGRNSILKVVGEPETVRYSTQEQLNWRN